MIFRSRARPTIHKRGQAELKSILCRYLAEHRLVLTSVSYVTYQYTGQADFGYKRAPAWLRAINSETRGKCSLCKRSRAQRISLTVTLWRASVCFRALALFAVQLKFDVVS